MPTDDFDAYVTTEPTRTRRGALKYQPDDADWSLDRLPELQDYFSQTYNRKLPITVKGQGSIHRKWNLDHRDSADISLNPTTTEGQAFITELQKRKVPFLAFDRAIPGVATGPHIHIGRPSHRGSGNFPVGSQVKRTSKVSKAQPSPTPDDFDRYVAEDSDDFDKYTVDDSAKLPVQPPTGPVGSAWRGAFGTPQQPTEAVRAGVKDFEDREATTLRQGIELGVSDFEQGISRAPVTNAGNAQPRDAMIRAKAEVRAARRFKSGIGMPQTLNPITAISDYLAGRTEEEIVGEEAAKRVETNYRESERLREIAGQFTDEDRRQLTNAVTRMQGMGSVSRGIETGSQRVGSSLLYKLAALTDLAGGPGTPQFPNYLGDYLRRQAGRGEIAVSEIENDLPPDVRQQLADFATSAVGALPEIAGATAVAGPIGGFAALGGLEAGGRKQPFTTVARETAKGALIGGVFAGAGAVEAGGASRTFGQRTLDTAKSGAAIGLGTFGVEKAFGADDSEALRAAAANVVFHVGMRVPGEVGRLTQAAERALKRPDGGTTPVGPELQALLTRAEEKAQASAPLTEAELKDPAIPLFEPTITQVGSKFRVDQKTASGSTTYEVKSRRQAEELVDRLTQESRFAQAKPVAKSDIPPADLTRQPLSPTEPAVETAATVPTAPSSAIDAAYIRERIDPSMQGARFTDEGIKTQLGLPVEYPLDLLEQGNLVRRTPEGLWELTADVYAAPGRANERRSPSRTPDADWLELTPAERTAVRQQIDAEMAPRRSLSDLMAERAETGPTDIIDLDAPRPSEPARLAEEFARRRVEGTDELSMKAAERELSRQTPSFQVEQFLGEKAAQRRQRLEERAARGDEWAKDRLQQMDAEEAIDLTSRDIDAGPASTSPRAALSQELSRAADFHGKTHWVAQALADSPLRDRVLSSLPKDSVLAGTNPAAPEMHAGPIRLRAPDGSFWEVDLAHDQRGPGWKRIGSVMDGFAVRKVIDRSGEGGFLDISEIVSALTDLRAKFPDKSERELRGMLPPAHRQLLDQERPLSAAASQPRTDTGQFSPGVPGGPEAAKSLLRSEARKYADNYKRLDLHSARRNGLDIVNDDIARNYFSALHRMATEFSPKHAEAVDRAESLYNQGKYSQATMLAESVFRSLPDKVNEYSSAMAAIQLGEMGMPAKTNWSKVLQEVRERLQRTGGLSGGGSTFYDVNKAPEGGRPDHAKIAYILEPVVEALKADARRLIAEGKLKATDYVDHVRRAVTEMLKREEFGDWHPLNKSAAFGVLVDKLGKEGPPPAAPPTAEAQPPQQRQRSLPKTLEKSDRDPGTNLTYDRLPNTVVNERVETRLRDEGPEALEQWYRAAPESADRTAAHRVLVDHYTARALELADTAPQQAQQLIARARELSNLESERATTLGQAIQQYSQLLKYTAPGVLREVSRMEAQGAKVPAESVTKLVQQAKELEASGREVERLERKVAEAEVEAGEQPAPAEGVTPRPRRYAPQGAEGGGGKRTRKPSAVGGGEGGSGSRRGPTERAERARRELDEAARRRRAQRQALANHLRQIEQQRTPAGYWKRAMNITRGLMVSALSTAMRNLQSQAVRFDIERLTDAVEHTMRKSVGLDSEFTYRNIARNTARQFRIGQTTEARDILTGHDVEYTRMFNNYAGGVEVPIPGGVRNRVERVFQTVERGVEIANFFNRVQEFHVRSAEFLAELDLHLRKEHNQTLEQFVQRNGIDAIPQKLIERSVDKALEVTFAAVPPKDGAGGRLINSLIEVGNYIPPTISPVAFPRFMFNNIKFLYQHSPAGMLDLARRGQNRPRVIARSLVGTSLLLLAYQFRQSDHAGEKWYELKIGGKTLDARPFGPFSTYLFLAEAIRRQRNGEKPFTVEEIAGAIGASSGPGGTAIATAERLYNYISAGNWEKAQRILKTEAGEWGRALLTPVRQVKDLIAAFDASQAVNRDTSLSPALGPIQESIPYADTNLPPAHKPTTATPIHQERPATKALTGWRVQTPKTFLERELDTMNFTSAEIRPSTGVPAIDQLEKRLMGPLMDELSTELEKDAEYRRMSKKEKAVYLKDFIKEIREEVREQGKAEQPELYEKLEEERTPHRQRELNQELNSPGLSKALQLGVPMPIPPRRPDEDDIAYRARLLQVGRARRQRLDSVVDFSLPIADQRMRLHSALYS